VSEVRDRHGRSGIEGLAVDLGLVFLDDGRVVADQPLSADGKTAESLGFRNAGLLQKVETAAARADEDKLGVTVAGCARGEILGRDIPAAGRLGEVDDPVTAGDAAPRLLGEPVEQLAGDDAEIHIRAARHPGRGDGTRFAALNQQRRPSGDRRAVGGEFHLLEEVMRRHPGVTGLEIVRLVPPMDKTQVGDGVINSLGLSAMPLATA
jgi:hypothetical protein